MTPRFFPTPARWRAWLLAHHADRSELWVGFYKRASGRPSITWPESVDQALCFGWIDGVRKSLDAKSYVIRFTPRRPGSVWSDVNTRRVKQLIAQGLVHEAGLAAFRRREDSKASRYSFEQRRRPKLPPALLKRFKADGRAWTFFRRQPPGYQRLATWWIVSAKKDETRSKRLEILIADSRAGRRLGPLQRKTAAG
ncbi:MAG TPA: YdeI/OmpD-associated family protein [Vicinamibacteria bacterium]|nr:YdeI/OmpD-associated family protein [Vicinamibacteria bacterium]